MALKISLIVNLGLLGCLIFIGIKMERKATPAMPTAPMPVITSAPPINEITSPAPQTKPVALSPFQWNQLESKDYRTYVKNLRTIGCPENTLRAIVTADVDGVYATRHHELEQQIKAWENSSWSERLTTQNQHEELTTELQHLPGAERTEIDDLLGIKAASPLVAAAPPPNQNRQQPIALPMVMQNLDLSQLNFNDQQKQAFEDVHQQFLADVGGSNQYPHDPAYWARWQKAQSVADNQLLGQLGNDAYIKIQLMTYQKSLASQPQ